MFISINIMDSKSIIIILLLILIFLNIWDIYNRDGFSNIGGQFFNVDYNTRNVMCDDLTGTNPCIVQTVKPNRKEVCTSKLNFISPNERIGMPSSIQSERRFKDQMSIDNGMSLDQMDDIEDEMYSVDNKLYIKENDNKIKKYLSDENTLSDVDDQLL